MKTLYLGPDELMVGMKVAVAATDSAQQVAQTIDALEQRVRAAVPIARVLYIEPDIYDSGESRRPALPVVQRLPCRQPRGCCCRRDGYAARLNARARRVSAAGHPGLSCALQPEDSPCPPTRSTR